MEEATLEEASKEEAAEEEANKSCVFIQDVLALNEICKEKVEEFAKQPRRGFNKKKTEELKDKVCSYLKKGYCNYSLSGRKPLNRVSHCPFLHPHTCPKLLKNGTRARTALMETSAASTTPRCVQTC